MTIHTQPAAIDSVKKSLVALRMPRALEMLDATLRRVEQGQCRATASALRHLAKVHGLAVNDYMEKVASAMA